jgi:hypothetical protein
MKTSLRVFVCSTYSDLSEERESVLDAIRRLQLQHDSMEFFGARANQPIETCLAEVRRSNILVVIVGHRYGTLAPQLGVSFSEAEYAEGYRLEKPCLVYIRDENVPVLPKHMERDPDKLRLLENWKATLQERHTVAAYQESKDLAVQVAADLSRTITELQEAARTREEARADSPALLDEVRQLVAEAIKTGATEAALLSSIRRSVSTVISEAQHVGASVFLSYADSDREIVRKVADALQERGIRVWFDEFSVKIGGNWLREIERGLDSADFVLFFISPSSVQEKWAQREIQVALHRQVSGERGAVILPILLAQAEVPPLLRNIQWLDMTDGDVDKAARTILDKIQYHSARQGENDGGTRIVGKTISKTKIVDVLAEERGVVGAAAKRLGVSPKRLYQLLKYNNIQAREFR